MGTDQTKPPFVVPLLFPVMAFVLFSMMALIKICFNIFLGLNFIMKIIPMCKEFCDSNLHVVLALRIT